MLETAGLSIIPCWRLSSHLILQGLLALGDALFTKLVFVLFLLGNCLGRYYLSQTLQSGCLQPC